MASYLVIHEVCEYPKTQEEWLGLWESMLEEDKRRDPLAGNLLLSRRRPALLPLGLRSG